jgi:PAS domain S-box-containing protein
MRKRRQRRISNVHFRDLPIRRKLMLAIVLTSAVALLLGGGAMIFFEFVRSRHLLVRELSTETEIIAANSAAAVAFQDRRSAREILAALQSHPAIVQASLFTPDGKLFVEYRSDKSNADFPDLKPELPGHRLDKNHVLVFRPVKLYGDMVGSISLRSDLREETARLQASMSIAVVALLTALFVSLLLSIRFQKIISKPVLELADVAHEVMKRKDYSLRASKESDDEIGQLIGTFNQMLVQIEKRDVALGASEERFRQLAENISEVFWITDLTKEKVIYISPAYETVWGRTCESVYQSPQTWVEAIHVEDRERIVCAAKTKQEKGEPMLPESPQTSTCSWSAGRTARARSRTTVWRAAATSTAGRGGRAPDRRGRSP